MGIDSRTLDLYRANGLTVAGINYIQTVRGSPPARRVGGTRFLSVACRFPSAKMGCTIQAESRTGEYPLVLQMELDEDVIEYYDQPLALRIARVRKGRNHVSAYTPDFLVLRSGQVEVIEVKPREAVEKAREKYPHEWVQRGGRWVYLPIAVQFDQMGIRYYIHLAEDINAVSAANLNLLVAAKRGDPHPNEPALLKEMHKTLNSSRASTVQSLVADLTLKDASTILRWIASRVLFAATAHQLLSDVHSARVFADEASAARFIAARDMPAIDGSAPCASLTDGQLEVALARYHSALPAINGERMSTRNERRWIRSMESAVAAGHAPLHGFVPLRHKCWRRPKTDPLLRVVPIQN